MKILILSKNHPYKRSGTVAKGILDVLKSIEGNDVKLIVGVRDRYSDNDIVSIDNYLIDLKNQLQGKWEKLLKKVGILRNNKVITNPDYHVLDYDQTSTIHSTNKFLKKAGFIPDAVIVLFMPKFLSFKNLYEINQITKAPIYIYPMDMAPMTGGCHYAWDCESYVNKCGNCPAMYSDDENDQSRKNWEFKKKYIDKANIKVIYGTRYLYRQLKKSSIFKEKEMHYIPLSIDEELFKPGSMRDARKYHNLPNGTYIVLCGANNINHKRKGINELLEALKIIKAMNPSLKIHLAIVGRSTSDFTTSLPYDYSMLGRLSFEELVRAYQAADVFVSPSTQDSGPMMVSQAMMCGTPVVAYEMGVAVDLVITGKTGYRAKLQDSNDLAKGIMTILSLDRAGYEAISENCRDLCVKTRSKEKYRERWNIILNNNV